MELLSWWGKNIFIAVCSFFFLSFSIETVIGSFYLKNPLEFIMLFFSAGLMLLISIVGIVYFVCQMHTHFKHR